MVGVTNDSDRVVCGAPKAELGWECVVRNRAGNPDDGDCRGGGVSRPNGQEHIFMLKIRKQRALLELRDRRDDVTMIGIMLADNGKPISW